MKYTDSLNILPSGTLLRNATYRIQKILGRGGFGITYLATDLTLEREVAIKEFFLKDYCDRDGSVTSIVTVGTAGSKELFEKYENKFLKEAKNIAKHSHPGIVKIYAAFQENNTAYYVMEYIKGESLAEMVKRQGPLPVGKAIRYIRQVGEALEYVHSHRINHLDIKPANIMIDEKNDRPTLIDFGLAKQYDAVGHETSTTPTGISYGYAPIEQYVPGGVSEFSAPADIYSLTATLYFMLTGQTPPPSVNLVKQGLTFPDGFPKKLIPVVRKGMAINHEERYQTVRQFIQALDAVGDIKEKKSKKKKRSETTIVAEIVSETKESKDRRISPNQTKDNKETDNSENKPKRKKIKFIIFGALGVIIIATVCFIILLESGLGSNEKSLEDDADQEEYSSDNIDKDITGTEGGLFTDESTTSGESIISEESDPIDSPEWLNYTFPKDYIARDIDGYTLYIPSSFNYPRAASGAEQSADENDSSTINEYTDVEFPGDRATIHFYTLTNWRNLNNDDFINLIKDGRNFKSAMSSDFPRIVEEEDPYTGSYRKIINVYNFEGQTENEYVYAQWIQEGNGGYLGVVEIDKEIYDANTRRSKQIIKNILEDF